jgi:hypothetical protein
MNKSYLDKALEFDESIALDVPFGMLNKLGRKRKKKRMKL